MDGDPSTIYTVILPDPELLDKLDFVPETIAGSMREA